jgi:hypothetical protein
MKLVHMLLYGCGVPDILVFHPLSAWLVTPVQGLMKLMQLKQSMGGMMSSMSRMMGVGAEDDVIEQVCIANCDHGN